MDLGAGVAPGDRERAPVSAERYQRQRLQGDQNCIRGHLALLWAVQHSVQHERGGKLQAGNQGR